MTFRQALVYFFREAGLNLVRSWKVGLLAVLTIAVSLFLTGVFLILSENLGRVLERWGEESRLIIYLEAEATDADRARVHRHLVARTDPDRVTEVSSAEAERRFRDAFPSLGDLLDGWGGEPLPGSFEVALGSEGVINKGWLEELRGDQAVAMVDDDRDWLSQLQTIAMVVRGAGLVLGGVLLATSIFTIASIIRLTAYLYRDEIAVMRMVGATEFFIRGPFYAEGLLQGLVGGVGAIAALAIAHGLVIERHAEEVLSLLFAAEFLGPVKLLLLVALGGVAGLIGAVASLRRESLGPPEETPEWARE